jgi:hypothetical protein
MKNKDWKEFFDRWEEWIRDRLRNPSAFTQRIQSHLPLAKKGPANTAHILISLVLRSLP